MPEPQLTSEEDTALLLLLEGGGDPSSPADWPPSDYIFLDLYERQTKEGERGRVPTLRGHRDLRSLQRKLAL
jgi:hypothetical protein